MAGRPEAEVAIDEEMLRALLGEQHPDLAGLPLVPGHGGWDNEVWRLGDDLAVRIPRRSLGAPLVLHEQRWLPVLAPRLPVPIPAPLRVGRPGAGYPWHWSICPWLDGLPAATRYGMGGASLVEGLAAFVSGLHVPAPGDAPRNPYRGVPLTDRDADVRDRLTALAGGAQLVGLWDEAVAAPEWEGDPVWIHGDLHPANLLVDGDGALAAVLDFGDLASGDPATDLAVAWMVFDAAARERFIARVTTFCGWDDATWHRAHGWAINLGSSFAVHADGDPEFTAISGHTLRQVLL